MSYRATLVIAVVCSAPSAGVAAQSSAAQLQCLLEPSLVVEVGTEITGVIDSVSVDRGDTVSKGQVVARLRSGAQRAAIELARARADFGRRKELRNADLYRDELISIHDKDEVETERVLAELELSAAEQQLAMRTLRSTVEGVVVERYLGPGEFVRDSRVMRLAQINPLNVEVIVPVALFGSIETGMDVEVRPNDPVGGVYRAKVVVVDRVIDAASGTFGVRLQLNNPDHQIPAGLGCKVDFNSAMSQSVTN